MSPENHETIQNLIVECRKEWATTGAGIVDLMWHPLEDVDPFEYAFDKNKRQHLCTLWLPDQDGVAFEGDVTMSLQPRPGKTRTMLDYEGETQMFDSVAQQAGAIVASEYRQTLLPYLRGGELMQSQPTNWWIAFLWFLFGENPASKDQQSDLHLKHLLYLSLQALERLEGSGEASSDEIAAPSDPSTKPMEVESRDKPDGEDIEPDPEFWADSPRQQRRIVRFLLDNGGRTTRKKLESHDGIFKEPPPTEETLRKALNRVGDALSAHASGWSLKWSADLANTAAEVWLKPPDNLKTESGLNPD